MVLALSGSGKTTSWAGREKYGIKGLDPKETFVIQCINRSISNPNYKLCDSTDLKDLKTGNRIQVDEISGLDRFKKVAEVIDVLKDPKCPYRNIVVDDINYLMQDYYMANAMRGGWDTPKQIGYGMSLVFKSFTKFPEKKNLIICGHYAEEKGVIKGLKTTGNMTDEYLTPGGKVDITLYIRQEFDEQSHKASKFFVKEFDGTYPAKDSIGALDELPDVFPNDLGLVVDALKKRYNQ